MSLSSANRPTHWCDDEEEDEDEDDDEYDGDDDNGDANSSADADTDDDGADEDCNTEVSDARSDEGMLLSRDKIFNSLFSLVQSLLLLLRFCDCFANSWPDHQP